MCFYIFCNCNRLERYAILHELIKCLCKCSVCVGLQDENMLVHIDIYLMTIGGTMYVLPSIMSKRRRITRHPTDERFAIRINIYFWYTVNDAECLNEMRYRLIERQNGYKGGEFHSIREIHSSAEEIVSNNFYCTHVGIIKQKKDFTKCTIYFDHTFENVKFLAQ